MNVKIISDIGENSFDLKEGAIFSLLSTALSLQNRGTETSDTYFLRDERIDSVVANTQAKIGIRSKSRVESMFGEGWKKENDKNVRFRESSQNSYDEIGYKGFMIVMCEHCKNIKGFCTKTPMTEYKCGNCSERTSLKGLKKVFLKCECGNSYKYQTNVTSEQFTYNCLNCGYPVELKYNGRKDVYQTM